MTNGPSSDLSYGGRHSLFAEDFLMLLSQGHLTYESRDLEDFCRRWQIRQFSLFGSALRPDFGPQSDIDVLVGFDSDSEWDALDLFAMQDELEERFGRKVDLVKDTWLQNPVRRDRILETRKVLFESGQK